jgi:diguanylate cyclase (GGDEF)-like protein
MVSFEGASRKTFLRPTMTYILALAVIATLSVVTHLVVDTIVQSQEAAARVVNTSGRQRMLSQRVAGLAMEASNPGADRVGLEADLKSALDLMEAAHGELLAGIDGWGNAMGGRRAISAIYYDAPYGLDGRVRAFIATGRAVLTLAVEERRDSAALADVLAAARHPMLSALDAAVKQYEADSEAAIHRLRSMLLGMLGLMLATLAAEAMFIFRPLFRRLSRARALLVEAASTDPLAGCMNRRYFMESATREFERALRHSHPTGLLMIDIDHFKAINDTYGHPVGDDVIICLAATIKDCLRGSDLFGRIGGEEFALVLPDTEFIQVLVVAEKLRLRLAESGCRAKGVTLHYTVSVGATMIMAEDHSLFDAMKRADELLYRAKHEGRNRVVGSAETV